MNNQETHYVVGVGGGADWLPAHGHGERMLDSIRNVRAAKLAQHNPQFNYIILDVSIPRPEANKIHAALPNLHFVEHKIAHPVFFPFADASVDRVEINHMWTLLTARPTVAPYEDIKGISGAADYMHVLREASRVLKQNGVLSITEKEDRLNKIRAILSRDKYLDLNGMFMSQLSFEKDPEKQELTRITEPHRSYYSQLAFAHEDVVYCLDLRKK
jgi:hypothetical protein